MNVIFIQEVAGEAMIRFLQELRILCDPSQSNPVCLFLLLVRTQWETQKAM